MVDAIEEDLRLVLPYVFLDFVVEQDEMEELKE